QLGARLGRIGADRPLSLLGSHQGLEPAHRLSLVSQSSGRNQGEEKTEREAAEEGGPQPSHPAGTGGGTDFPGGKLVSHAKTAGQRRQRLRRPERVAETSRERGVDQSRASRGRVV